MTSTCELAAHEAGASYGFEYFGCYLYSQSNPGLLHRGVGLAKLIKRLFATFATDCVRFWHRIQQLTLFLLFVSFLFLFRFAFFHRHRLDDAPPAGFGYGRRAPRAGSCGPDLGGHQPGSYNQHGVWEKGAWQEKQNMCRQWGLNPESKKNWSQRSEKQKVAALANQGNDSFW